MSRTRAIGLGALLVGWAALLWGPAARPACADPGSGGAAAPWTSFVLEAKGLSGTATAEVELQSLCAAAEAARFIDSPRGRPLAAAGDEVHRLAVVTSVDLIGGRRILLENRLWFDPATNAPLYLERTRLGLKDYRQWFRFTAEGVFRLQQEPASAKEALRPPESWTKHGKNFYPYPASRTDCPPIIETSQLISFAGFIASEPDTAAGPLCVFHKRQLHRVRLSPQPDRTIDVDYMETRGGDVLRRKGAVAARGVRVSSRPIGSYRGEVEEFFRDGSELWGGAEDRIPLAVGGEVPFIGRVEMRLKEIRLK
ncbi:MAG: hypothetical protein MUD16_09785 [Desulfobacterales bacterium]|jgi:hypothetical protein|nr:hypothetical protein [Desulfobacterales bacterium]